MIPGFEVGITQMRPGSKRRLIVPAAPCRCSGWARRRTGPTGRRTPPRSRSLRRTACPRACPSLRAGRTRCSRSPPCRRSLRHRRARVSPSHARAFRRAAAVHTEPVLNFVPAVLPLVRPVHLHVRQRAAQAVVVAHVDADERGQRRQLLRDLAVEVVVVQPEDVQVGQVRERGRDGAGDACGMVPGGYGGSASARRAGAYGARARPQRAVVLHLEVLERARHLTHLGSGGGGSGPAASQERQRSPEAQPSGDRTQSSSVPLKRPYDRSSSCRCGKHVLSHLAQHNTGALISGWRVAAQLGRCGCGRGAVRRTAAARP